MATKTIKNVDEATWRKLKALSAEENRKIGELLKNMTESYAKGRSNVWDEILSGKKILSDSEASDMEKIAKRLRRERGFR